MLRILKLFSHYKNDKEQINFYMNRNQEFNSKLKIRGPFDEIFN